MAESIIRKTLDTVRQNRTSTIYAVQTDYSARFIDAIITSENVPVFVESSSTVTINALRRDNQAKSYEGTVNENGSVRVPVTQWMLELEGSVVCTISILTTETKLSTTQFVIEVQKTPYDGTTISVDDPDYDIYAQILNEINVIKNDITDLQTALIGVSDLIGGGA